MDKHPPTFLQNTYYTLKKGGNFPWDTTEMQAIGTIIVVE